MRAVVYSSGGGPEVLRLVERPEPVPGPDEVLIKVAVSGVNPTDHKSREAYDPDRLGNLPEVVPGQDGAGVIAAVGPGADPARVGQRVWLWEAAHQGPDHGTAQELVVLPSSHAVALPDPASLDLGAGLGIPALTAHRCLTLALDGPRQLAPGALEGRTILVQGGAGAVGNAAIQLARWAGATVVASVSNAAKARLASGAGASLVINYRQESVPDKVRAFAPDGVDLIVEVNPAVSVSQDNDMLGPNGIVAVYAGASSTRVTLPVRKLMTLNVAWHFVLIYTIPQPAKAAGIAAITAAVAAGAFRAGDDGGLPFHRFPLEAAAEAHAAVEAGAVGKVLLDLG